VTPPSDSRGRDTPDCPQCGAMGILPPHREHTHGAVTGTVENPVFIHIGDMTDEEIDELAGKLNEYMVEVASSLHTPIHPAAGDTDEQN
jgi:hypothetical protein